FEEGWSEIDHVVRYPNFSNNQHVSNFLQIFNRLSGSADEMGSFAKQLAKELQDRTEMLEKLQREYDETKAENSVNEDKIKSLFSQLKDLSDDNADKSALISELEHAVEKKNRMASLMDNDAFLSTLNRNIPIHLNANIPSAAMLGTLSEKQKKVIEDAALLTNKIVSNINLATSSTHNFNLSSSKNNNNEVGAKIKPKKTPVK
ncbi:TPA: hypothetical protein ACSP2N_003953, partial [Aeromonas veronii]